LNLCIVVGSDKSTEIEANLCKIDPIFSITGKIELTHERTVLCLLIPSLIFPGASLCNIANKGLFGYWVVAGDFRFTKEEFIAIKDH